MMLPLFIKHLSEQKQKDFGYIVFEFVFTPKHGNWPNVAEIELQMLNGQCLNRHISTIKRIYEEIDEWQTNRNNKNKKKLAVHKQRSEGNIDVFYRRQLFTLKPE